MKNFVASLQKILHRKKLTVSADIKRDAFLQYGREQFKALIKKGLEVPVVLL